MSLCECTKKSSYKVNEIGHWDHCALEGGAHTSFIVLRCLNCKGIRFFPGENGKLALTTGTEETKAKLTEIISENEAT